jgi:hypothetical protein
MDALTTGTRPAMEGQAAFYRHEAQELSLFDLIDVFWAFKWLFLAVTALVMVAGFALVSHKPVPSTYTQYVAVPSYVNAQGDTQALVPQNAAMLAMQQLIAQRAWPVSVTALALAPAPGAPNTVSFLKLSVSAAHLNQAMAARQVHALILQSQQFFQSGIQRQKALLQAQANVLALQLKQLATPSVRDAGHALLAAELADTQARLAVIHNMKPWGAATYTQPARNKVPYVASAVLAVLAGLFAVFLAQVCVNYRVWRKREQSA